MARTRKLRSNIWTSRPVRRDTSVITIRRMHHGYTNTSPRFTSHSFYAAPFIRRDFVSVQDNRQFNFNPLPELLTNRGTRARVVTSALPSLFIGSARTNRNTVPNRLKLYAPSTVITCVRRKIRRSVIHALGIAGSRVSRPKRNASTHLSC